MRSDEVWSTLAEVFEGVFGEPIALSATTSAEDVEGWDSVRSVELMVAIEEAFGLRLPTAGLGAFVNLGALVTHVLDQAARGARRA
jgi:acyl carrier protein